MKNYSKAILVGVILLTGITTVAFAAPKVTTPKVAAPKTVDVKAIIAKIQSNNVKPSKSKNTNLMELSQQGKSPAPQVISDVSSAKSFDSTTVEVTETKKMDKSAYLAQLNAQIKTEQTQVTNLQKKIADQQKQVKDLN